MAYSENIQLRVSVYNPDSVFIEVNALLTILITCIPYFDSFILTG